MSGVAGADQEPRLPRWERALLLAGKALGAAVVLAMFLHQPGLQHYQPANLLDMVHGTASRPFVERMLVPSLVRGGMLLLPEAAAEWLKAAGSRHPVAEVLTFFDRIPPRAFGELLLACLLMYAALLGFLWALEALCRSLYRTSERFVRMVPLLALALLPVMFCYTSYLYDFPVLFLFTLGLVLIHRRRWGPYLALFAVSCINKETTILLTLICALVLWTSRSSRSPSPSPPSPSPSSPSSSSPSSSISPRRSIMLLLVQVVIFVAVKLATSLIFKRNPGGSVEYHLLDHNIYLLHSYPVGTVMGYLAIFLLVAYRWQEKPLFLKQVLTILPILLVLTLFLGFLDELRDYYEVFPALVLLIAHTIARLLGVPLELRPAPPACHGDRRMPAVAADRAQPPCPAPRADGRAS